MDGIRGGGRNVGKAVLVAMMLLCSLLVLNQCKKEQPQLGPAAYIKDTLTLPYNVDIDEDLNVDGDVTIDGSASVGGIAALNLVGINHLVVGEGITTTYLTLSGGNVLSTKGAVTVTDNLQVNGNAAVTGTLVADGLVTAQNGVRITGGLTLLTASDIAQANGGVTITDDLDITGDISMHSGGTINMVGTGAITVGDDLVTQAIYANDDINAALDVRVSDFLILEDVGLVDIITVTTFITPTRSMQRVTAEAWVSPTVNGGCVPGLFWMLYNWGDKNIYLADGSALILSDNFTMGQHDTLWLVCNAGGNWAEFSRSNN